MANPWNITHTPLKADPYLAIEDKNALSAGLRDVADALAVSGEVPQGSYADVAQRLKAIEANQGQTYRQLRITPNASAPTAKLDVSWASMGIGGYAVGAFGVATVDIAALGLNGRSTSAALATKIYYLWAVYNPTTRTVGLLLDPSASAPTLSDATLSGYTAYRLLSEVKQTGSSASLRAYNQQDNRITLESEAVVAGPLSGTLNTWNTQALAPSGNEHVGTLTRSVVVQLVQNKNNDAGTTTFVQLRRKGAASGTIGVGMFERANNAGDVRGRARVAVSSATAEIEWLTTATLTNGGGQGFFIYLIEYDFPV